jgi:uncharacterized membrane protein YedE/YeeE
VKGTLGTATLGLALGFALSRIGFSSWDEVHHMFTFESLRLLLSFCTAVAVMGVGWYVVAKASNPAPQWTPRTIHKGTVAGGLLFGAGWAISGDCPSNALVQLGEGKLLAVLTVVGIFAGNWLYSAVHERYFRWTAASCNDD